MKLGLGLGLMQRLNLLKVNSELLIKQIVLGINIENFKDIPIIINNYNRLGMLVGLIEDLTERGYENIDILDNRSSYPPLLEWYEKSPFTVFRLNQNLGYLAFEKSGISRMFERTPFVLTDPDLRICPKCPADFLGTFMEMLNKYPMVSKVGFSLKIDDIPDYYIHKDKVISWEKQFWEKTIDGKNFIAPIDTTFALHRAFSPISTFNDLKNIRMAPPYTMRHLPWYIDEKNLDEEEIYYRTASNRPTHWTNHL